MTTADTLSREYSAKRMANIKPSASMAVAIEISKLRQEGTAVHSLAIGQRDFAPPHAATSAMLDAVNRNDTGYVIENRPLISAIIERFEKDSGLKFGENEVAVGAGLKQIIFAAFCSTIDEGDEVVVPLPIGFRTRILPSSLVQRLLTLNAQRKPVSRWRLSN